MNLKIKRKRRLSQRRRRKGNRGVRKTQKSYFAIDGNFTRHPVAYCTYYHGVLTNNLMNVHKCRARQCCRLREGDQYD